MTPIDSSAARDGLQKARALVGALLGDDDETYASLMSEILGGPAQGVEAVIASMAGLVGGNVHMLAETQGRDPLEFWLEGVQRSMDKGV